MKVALIHMIAILMMSGKLAVLSFPKIKIFWNGDKISVHGVTNKISSGELRYCGHVVMNYVDVVMWCDESWSTLAFLWEKLS